MGSKLLIVESPAKAKTIGKYLGKEFTVKSSVGHVRDLPRDDKAIRIVEDGENHWKFTPVYVVSDGKEKVVADLKAAVKASDEIYLASDPDREGEAIAWHLKELLAPVAGNKPFHRVTYNEITKSAVLNAVAAPRDIDLPLVDAQQARRILDRLVGYRVSPLLWKNVQCVNNRTLSAGRVQSVALRLLVERQREIDAFVPVKYFLLGVETKKAGESKTFIAKLSRFDNEKPMIATREQSDNVLFDLSGSVLKVEGVKRQPKVRRPLPPFTTSTLQQAASSVLGFSPGKTMKLAQSLYESGSITYMRTDSVNVSEQARQAAKELIVSEYGNEYYPTTPNFYKSKADAQGAHEAIRPTNIGNKPGKIELEAAEAKLYELIWRRFVASQMVEARTSLTTISLVPVKVTLAHSYLFTASATTIEFEGFLKVMKLAAKRKASEHEDDGEDSDEVAYLPSVAKGEELPIVRYLADEKETKGPSHYSEASLIKALEENGVGRPSTYAQTIETLKLREYASNEKRKLVPLERGKLVCDWLVGNMEKFFSVGFTAGMEHELDQIAEHGEPMDAMLSNFYRELLAAIPRPVPPPPRESFMTVLALLGEVQQWKPAKTIGKRTYDDRAFFVSCREQFELGEKPMSAKQLEFLVRMAISYAGEIADCEARLKAAGIGMGATKAAPTANPELVAYCFSVMERIGGGLLENKFFKSLHNQVERGRGLSLKQFAILAKAVGENASALNDAEAIRAKLLPMVPGGFAEQQEDPAVVGMLSLMGTVTEWNEPVRKGKKVYDDKEFVESIKEQFARRRTLSDRQLAALRRVVGLYASRIPDFEAKCREYGLDFSHARKK